MYPVRTMTGTRVCVVSLCGDVFTGSHQSSVRSRVARAHARLDAMRCCLLSWFAFAFAYAVADGKLMGYICVIGGRFERRGARHNLAGVSAVRRALHQRAIVGEVAAGDRGGRVAARLLMAAVRMDNAR